MLATQQLSAARTAVLAAFAVIVLFAAVSEQILAYLKASMPALQAAGGLLFLLVAAQLLRAPTTSRVTASRSSR